MANHKSAQKRILQNAKRNERNRYWRSTMRTAVKDVRAAAEAGDGKAAAEALKVAIRVIDRVSGKGVIHANQASRRISRLTRLVNGI